MLKRFSCVIKAVLIQERIELRRLLKMFFSEVDLSQRDVLSKNKTAKLLKSNLLKLGYWKNKPRGDPSAGFRKSKSTNDFKNY